MSEENIEKLLEEIERDVSANKTLVNREHQDDSSLKAENSKTGVQNTNLNTEETSAEKPSLSLTKEETESTIKDELNVACENFDPLQALYAEELRISKKEPKIKFQNLAAFDTALKRFGVWGLQQKSTDKPANDGPASSKKLMDSQLERRFLPHQMPIKSSTVPNVKQRNNKNILKWLEQIEGPLKLLALAMKSQKRIHVVLRNEHGVRGYVEGKVLCFDKHWNLLLSNVLEKWRRRKFKYGINKTSEAGNPSQDCTVVLNELGITLPRQTVKSLNRKNVEITRELEQLFIRGEQIVLINILTD